jgi:hypothetical protein
MHVPITLTAYFLNGIAVLVDKFLLSHKITHPLIYIFYISLISLVILVLIPFTHVPTLVVFLLASASTLLWTAGLYVMYQALLVGLVTRVIPIIGALIPMMLLIFAITSGDITKSQMLAVTVLIIGIVLLTIFEIRGKMHPKEIQYELVSAFLFAISYTLLRFAYLQDHFFTVFIWSRVILVPLGILLLCLPTSRGIILGTKEKPSFSLWSKSGTIFLGGQVAGGISELLLTYSVSLANPALVNSLQGSQYIFLFIASIFLAKRYPQIFAEKHQKWAMVLKVLGIICVGIGLYIMAFGNQS